MSEVIITAEMKEDARKCNGRSCTLCRMYPISKGVASSCIEALASLPGVWDQAPKKAIEAYVNFGYSSHMAQIMDDGIKYTRTIPKALEEEIKDVWSEKLSMMSKANLELFIPIMLKEYNERQGGK